jgi:hypothetical protein
VLFRALWYEVDAFLPPRGEHEMKKSLLAALLLAGTMFWSQSATATERFRYCKIEAQIKLDGRGHPSIIEGREALTWSNLSPDTITELQFHLYLNAFKNEKSTFFRESGGQLRGDRFAPGEWGGIDIKEMRIENGEDLTSKIEYIHPDDDNADDQTVIRVPLSKPLKPRESISLQIAFQSRLPRVFARTGYWSSFAMVAQWFPKIGVWETAGDRHRTTAGWNTHQFHANSEFYADFMTFDVTLTVPAVYKDKVGATGVLKSERTNADGTVTYNYYQENVHDFAWTLDTHYLKVVRQFKADEWVKPEEIDHFAKLFNLPPEQIRLKDVTVTLLIQPEHKPQIDRHFNATFNAIKYFGLWYGAYPYGTLTVIDPPYNGDGAGGMEYPTLITAGTTWWPGRNQHPEEVIVHEFGHQYWYGMVASNEFEESWLDEGFNTYSTAKVLGAAYGDDYLPFRFWGVPWFYFPVRVPRPFENRPLTLQGEFKDPIVTPSWKYYDSMSYGLNSYPRTGLVMNTLEQYLGEDVMARVMRTYFQRWSYKHPSSEDFFTVANEVSGQDLGWFFKQFVNGTPTLDYELAAAKSTKVETLSNGGEGKASPASGYTTEVDVRRLGEAYFPVDLHIRMKDSQQVLITPTSMRDGVIEYRITYADGSTSTDSWPIADRWKRFRLTTSSEVHSAQVDPQLKMLLDANLTNNGWAKTTGIRAGLRWSSGGMFWWQALLQVLSFTS